MKQQIRKSIFETNSSSIHSIVIGNNGENVYDKLPKSVHFNGGKFGWEHEIYRDTDSKANYLYTLIVNNGENVEKAISYIKETLNKWDVTAIFQELEETPTYDGKSTYLTFKKGYYYVDHSYDAKELVQKILNDETLLMNYLFSDNSFIETGNDNDDTKFIADYPKNVLLDYEKGN